MWSVEWDKTKTVGRIFRNKPHRGYDEDLPAYEGTIRMGVQTEVIKIKCTKCTWESTFELNRRTCRLCGADVRTIFDKVK